MKKSILENLIDHKGAVSSIVGLVATAGTAWFLTRQGVNNAAEEELEKEENEVSEEETEDEESEEEEES